MSHSLLPDVDQGPQSPPGCGESAVALFSLSAPTVCLAQALPPALLSGSFYAASFCYLYIPTLAPQGRDGEYGKR